MPRRPGPSSTSPISIFVSHRADVRSFGDMLTSLRKERGMSQTQLANAILHSTSFVSLLENDQRKPSRDLVDALAEALDLESDSDARHTLMRLVGYESNEILDIVERLIEAIAAQASMGVAERALASDDLKARVEDWLDYFKIRTLFDQGKFIDAVTRYQKALERQQMNRVLLTCLRMGLAETLVQHGKLADASEQIEAARVELGEQDASVAGAEWSPTLDAETIAIQGLVAVHMGDYIEARERLEQSIALYQKMLTAHSTTHRSAPDAEQDIAFLGIGSSYKRLAQVALLCGEAKNALTLCLAAETYLMRATKSNERKRWLLRTYEQLAWAYSELGDLDLAIELRARTRSELHKDHDTYGLARNSLYTADDYLREINKRVKAALSEALPQLTQPPDFSRRKHIIRQALMSSDVSAWLGRAESGYNDAHPELEQTGQDALLGRLLLNLGLTLRYKAILLEPADSVAFAHALPGEVERGGEAQSSDEEPDKVCDSPEMSAMHQTRELRATARELLTTAQVQEQQIGHWRRLPGVYEALGDLLMDENDALGAQYYYETGINILGIALGNPVDNAANGQYKRMRAALRAITTAEPSESALPRAIKSSNQTRWGDLCERLVAMVEQHVHKVARSQYLVAYSNKSDEWCERLLTFEKETGSRILAQNRLSSSLALRLPSGISLAGARNHEMRHLVFRRDIELTSASAGELAHRDLCFRESVENGLHNPDSADQVREQIENARTFMCEHPARYVLDMTPYELPLGFTVKGAHVLIEAPRSLAPRFIGQADVMQSPGQMLCMEFTSDSFAGVLRKQFDQLIEVANTINKKSGPRERVDEWLKRLLEMQIAATRGA